jgi:DNA modification methylase
MIIHGDCVEAMAKMPEASVDAVVCDPPYLLTFMGRSWDHAPTPAEGQAMHLRLVREALRVLKPGGHLLAFGGTRTVHRLTCGLEDAGFEIRDCLSWLYGSGLSRLSEVAQRRARGRARFANGSRVCAQALIRAGGDGTQAPSGNSCAHGAGVRNRRAQH